MLNGNTKTHSSNNQKHQAITCKNTSYLTLFTLKFTLHEELKLDDKVFLLVNTAHYLEIPYTLLTYSHQDVTDQYQNVNTVLSSPTLDETVEGVNVYVSLVVGCGDVYSDWLSVLERAEQGVQSNDIASHLYRDDPISSVQFNVINWMVSVIKPAIEAHRVKRDAQSYIQSTPIPRPAMPQIIRDEVHYPNVINAYPPAADPVNPMWGFGVGKNRFPSKHKNPEDQMMGDQPDVSAPRKKHRRSKNRALDFKSRHDRRWRRRQRKRKERRRRRKEKRVIDELMQLLPSVEEYDKYRPTPTTPQEPTKKHRKRFQDNSNIPTQHIGDVGRRNNVILEPTPVLHEVHDQTVEATPALPTVHVTRYETRDNAILNDEIPRNPDAPVWVALNTSPTPVVTYAYEMTESVHDGDSDDEYNDINNQVNGVYRNGNNRHIEPKIKSHNDRGKNDRSQHQNKEQLHATPLTQHQPQNQPTISTAVNNAETERSNNQRIVEAGEFNYGPIVLNGIKRLDAEVGDILDFQIPKNTFYDHEDGDASNLELHLLTNDGAEMTSASWITFNKHTRGLYAMPLPENIGMHSFVLSATDSGGKSVYEVFEITIRNRMNQWRINHEFSLSLDLEYQRFLKDIDQRMDVTQRLAKVYGDSTANHIHVTGVEHGSVVLTWTNKTVHSMDCPIKEITHLVGHFMDIDSMASRRLIDGMHPYRVLHVGASCRGSCRGDQKIHPIELGDTLDGTPHTRTEDTHLSNITNSKVLLILVYIFFMLLFIILLFLIVMLFFKCYTYYRKNPKQHMMHKQHTSVKRYFSNIRKLHPNYYTILEDQKLVEENIKR